MSVSPSPEQALRMPPVLIVGTGRCGSTLVSAMMRLHPSALSVSELVSFVTDLGTRIVHAFPDEVIDGSEFWDIVATPQPRHNLLLHHGLQMPEVLYRWERGRFDRGVGLPPIMAALIPHLEPDDPDTLFDALGAAMIRREPETAAAHYRAMLEWLACRFGRTFWVERSGGSLRVIRRLIDAFPEARIVHLVRDGRDTAVSMSRHIGFRMALLCGMTTELLGVDPFESCDRSGTDDLDDDLVALLPENFTAEAFRSADLPPELCGHYWSGEIREGLAVLDTIASERLMTIRYEELLAEPRKTVTALSRFMTDTVEQEWIETAAALVEPRPPRWSTLPAKEQAELIDACRPGFEALAARGVHWC